MSAQRQSSREKAESLARRHAKEALQEQSLHEPAELSKDEQLIYRCKLYQFADEIMGYKVQ